MVSCAFSLCDSSNALVCCSGDAWVVEIKSENSKQGYKGHETNPLTSWQQIVLISGSTEQDKHRAGSDRKRK